MASSFFALFDDIATILDDVATMTKVAVKKTAGVLGDDLALNAEQVSGVHADRELPVVWAVAKGSFANKAILVPAALVISAFAPVLITPLLMVGGAYLCFEGAEKLMHGGGGHDEELMKALADPEVDLVAFEKDKIKGAIRTDFVLSAEIIAITLNTVADRGVADQAMVLIAISVLITVGVYGLVAGIVKLDDLGLFLGKASGEGLGSRLKRSMGGLVLQTAPRLMRTLTVVGTIAMFLVGGGILVHGVAPLAQQIHHLGEAAGEVAGIGWLLGTLAPSLANGIVGLAAGALLVVLLGLLPKKQDAAPEG
ncbi:MAG: putative DNA repair protein MutK [Planctomycetota bacterium]|jgi:predicted DNA repair protein MutK